MAKELSLKQFYKNICEEVAMAQDTETYGWEDQDFFTAVMLEYLEEAEEAEDPIICPYRAHGLQLNAYSISDEYESVDIFVSIYNESDSPPAVSRTLVDAAIKFGLDKILTL